MKIGNDRFPGALGRPTTKVSYSKKDNEFVVVDPISLYICIMTDTLHPTLPTKKLAVSLKKSRTKRVVATPETSLFLRIAAAIRDDVLANGDLPPHAYVALTSLADPAPRIGTWPCPARPDVNTPRRKLEDDLLELTVNPLSMDIDGSHVKPTVVFDDGLPYPRTSINSDFAVMKRVIGKRPRSVRAKRATVPDPKRLDDALENALRDHRDIPNLTINATFSIEASYKEHRSTYHGYVHVYSRFATEEDPRNQHVNHNTSLVK